MLPLHSAGVTWGEDTLFDYLADPQKYIKVRRCCSGGRGGGNRVAVVQRGKPGPRLGQPLPARLEGPWRGAGPLLRYAVLV
jgi:hypothetical protein